MEFVTDKDEQTFEIYTQAHHGIDPRCRILPSYVRREMPVRDPVSYKWLTYLYDSVM